MNPSTPPTPQANHEGCDSLNAAIVLADDRGATDVLPADPEVLARYLAECRRLEPRPDPKTQESDS